MKACFRMFIVVIFVIRALILAKFQLPKMSAQDRMRCVQEYAKRFIRQIGVPVKIIGQVPPLSGSLGRLVVSNHISFLDIFVLNAVVPSCFVAKKEIEGWPIFGQIASATGTVFIDRRNRRALLQIGDTMNKSIEQGHQLLMFPEGTTSNGAGLLKLHANLFDAPAKSGAQVLPVVLRYKVGDEVTTRASYAGDISLFSCLWNILTTPGIYVELHVLEPVTGANRREICRTVSAMMSQVIGVPDPLGQEGDAS